MKKSLETIPNLEMLLSMNLNVTRLREELMSEIQAIYHCNDILMKKRDEKNYKILRLVLVVSLGICLLVLLSLVITGFLLTK